jgi:hypothetical protein
MEILEELKGMWLEMMELQNDNTAMQAEMGKLHHQQVELSENVDSYMQYVKDLGWCVVNTAITTEDVLETLEVMNRLDTMP